MSPPGNSLAAGEADGSRGFGIGADSRRPKDGQGLYERDRELALIDAVLASARGGTGQVALLEGSAGLGKSVLIAEAKRRAKKIGLKVLSAAASEKERSIPHGISTALFGPALQKLAPDERETVFVGAAVLARPLFDAYPETPADGELGLARLHGLFWLCANLAERDPLLLAIDDAQWMDAASARFLGHLLPRIEALPVAVLIGARPDAVQSVGPSYQGLRSHPSLHSATLSPLSKDTCEDIYRDVVEGEPDPERCERYWQISQGNPFLLEQLLAADREAGETEVEELLEQHRGTGDGLALAVARRKLVTASTDEQAFARVVAVLGPAASIERCARLSDLGLDAAKDALERLSASGVLLQTSPVGFVHPLIASAALDSISSTDLESDHRAAAEMLHREGSSAELVGSFLLQCAPVGETWAVGALQEAARRAKAVGALDSASLYLVRLLEEDLTDADRGRALLDLGRAEALTDTTKAIGHLRDSLQYFDDAQIRAEVFQMIGHQLLALGRYEEAADVFDQALDEVGESDPHLRFQLRVDRIGAARIVPSKRENALSELDALALDAPKPGEPVARQLYTEMALLHVRRGLSCEDAAEALHSAIPDLDDADGPAVVDWLLPPQMLCLSWTDQLEMAAKLRAAALAEARRRGSLMLFATAGCFGALGAYQEGSISESAALAQQAIDAIPDGWAQGIPYACTIGAYAQMERGDLNEADRILQLAFDHEGTEDSLQLGWLLEARARLALMWGTPEAAIEDLERAGRFMTEVIRTTNPAILGWRSRLARAYAAIGEDSKARDIAEEEIELARRYGAGRAISAALRTRGTLLGGEGVEDLEEALALIEDSPARLERAGVLVALGRASRMAGDVRRARELLNEGLRGAVLSGSVMLENVARAELASAGARPRRRAVTGVGALTPGERRVVDQAAQGRSNREIAESLFVTVKAVEWHLSNAYRKLGVPNREGLRGLDLDPGTD